MKRKLLIAILLTSTLLVASACGGTKAVLETGATTAKTEAAETETSSISETSVKTEKSTESKVSDVYFKEDELKINDATIKIKEIKVQEPNTNLGETNPTLVILYDFTNNKSELAQPLLTWIVCFNAQQETDVAFEDLKVAAAPQGDEYSSANAMGTTDIKPGATVESVISYEIKYPNSPVILNATQGSAGKELGKKIIDLKLYESEASTQAETETEIITTETTKETIKETTKEIFDSEHAEPVIIDDETKSSIKKFVEPEINDAYKTNFYTCDILTPTTGTGAIVSLQIESPEFMDEESCKKSIETIIENLLTSDMYKTIYSFQFSMISSGQLKFLIDINDAQSIKSASDIYQHYSSTAF